MAVLIVLLGFSLAAADFIHGRSNATLNMTSPQDMYVVRATVYQVGILTNVMKSANSSTGHQESITFYHTNGSNIDMSGIPRPLMTNVTAMNMVGVAPINGSSKVLPWSALKDFTMGEGPTLNQSAKIVKRDVAKIEKGAAILPKETGVQSIALPPLLTLNSNLSKIPVPIPNVSVVSYAKVNTVAHKP